MIKLSEDYSLDADRYQYIVIEHRAGTGKEGQPIRRDYKTYHRKLSQAADNIADECARAVVADFSGFVDGRARELEKALETSLKSLIRAKESN